MCWVVVMGYGRKVLLQYIEELRAELIGFAELKPLGDPEVVRMSQRLDSLLDAYHLLFGRAGSKK